MSNLFRKEAMENHSPNREITLAVKAIPVKWVVYMTVIRPRNSSETDCFVYDTEKQPYSKRSGAYKQDGHIDNPFHRDCFYRKSYFSI